MHLAMFNRMLSNYVSTDDNNRHFHGSGLQNAGHRHPIIS